MSSKLKVQFGCGNHVLEGWKNHDSETPIQNPLPYQTGTVEAVLAEHVIEHVPFHHGMSFLRESHRILVPGGTLRVSFPSVERVLEHPVELTEKYLLELGFPVGAHPIEQACKLMLQGWGHVAGWTSVLMIGAMRAAGFHIASRANWSPDDPEFDHRTRTWAGKFENVTCLAIK